MSRKFFNGFEDFCDCKICKSRAHRPVKSIRWVQPLHSSPSEPVLSKSINNQVRYSCYSVHYPHRPYIRAGGPDE